MRKNAAISSAAARSARRPVASLVSGANESTTGTATSSSTTGEATSVAGLGSGAPGGTRTHDLQVRNLTLYPLSYGRTRCRWSGGEGGIRTLDAGYPTWRFSKPLH